ncbi:MAG TPA: DUF6599 family protein [Terracidiphilus sp.]|nr:DUF6599 family protein [Terracidiphilus sp.]
MRKIAIFVCWAALLVAPSVAMGQGEPIPKGATRLMLPPAPLSLPSVFDGWVETGKPQTSSDPSEADPANAAALKEYGLTQSVEATYKRDGETLTLHAMRFGDVTGAYGAYSYYRQNGWPKVDVGTGGASDNNKVVFWKGATVVQATFSQVGPMSAADLREIANRMPVPHGNRGLLPPILASLPTGSLQPQTTHYAEGPAGYAGSGGVLPPELVGFDRDAETMTANYMLSSGTATLTIIDYPEPQIAEAQEQKIRAYIQAQGKTQPFTKALQDSDRASLEVRRSGPMVAIVSGDAIPDESHRLIEMVHYSPNLTGIPGGAPSQIQMTSELLMGIAGLVLIGAGAAILLGFFLGGGRVLYRVMRGKPVSSVYEEEFIHLDLAEKWDGTPAALHPPNPKG